MLSHEESPLHSTAATLPVLKLVSQQNTAFVTTSQPPEKNCAILSTNQKVTEMFSPVLDRHEGLFFGFIFKAATVTTVPLHRDLLRDIQ